MRSRWAHLRVASLPKKPLSRHDNFAARQHVQCDLSGVSDADRPLLDRVYKKPDLLLPKRNFLVHGETWDGQFKGKPKQPYRVGIVKKDPDYIDEFDRGQHGENVFSVEQVRFITRECRDIAADLDVLRRA
jgi:hypothetical protein